KATQQDRRIGVGEHTQGIEALLQEYHAPTHGQQRCQHQHHNMPAERHMTVFCADSVVDQLAVTHLNGLDGLNLRIELQDIVNHLLADAPQVQAVAQVE